MHGPRHTQSGQPGTDEASAQAGRSPSLTALLVMTGCNAPQCSEKQDSLAWGSCSHCLAGWLQSELLSAAGSHPDHLVTAWLLKAFSPFLG